MPNAQQLADLASERLRLNPYGWLVTNSPGAAPHARLVGHLSGDAERIWIGTSPRSRKAREAAESPLVTYAVEDRASNAYVAFQGHATVVDDPVARTNYWRESLEAFVPDGALGPDFVLISIEVNRIELMDFAEGVHPDPYGLVPAVLERDGTSWVMREAERQG